MPFESLVLQDWRQFHAIDLAFHPRLTILTGANGSGKTAILRLLARHFQWEYQELATPIRHGRGGVLRYLVWLQTLESAPPAHREIGRITYTKIPRNRASLVLVPQQDSATYQPRIADMPNVPGIFIPSHRPPFHYQQVSQIPVRSIPSEEAYQSTVLAYRQRAFGTNASSPSYRLKEVLLSWALLGYGNPVVEGDTEKQWYFERFQRVLFRILPPTLRFKSLEIRPPELVLITDTGEFMIDAVSGGISALIDLAWQIYTFDPSTSKELVVLIDEAENHLHASMQRTLLPTFVETFPNVQFIVSSHSPLVVSSVRDCAVYVLNYNERYKVVSERLDFVSRAGTATRILQDVLGVPVTLPIWVEHEMERLGAKYADLELSDEVLDALRADLAKQGLEEFAPQTIADIVRKRRAST